MKASAPAARITLMAALLFSLSSCSVMCNKKTALQGTRWVAEFQDLIFDVGTATGVLSLEFISGKDFTLTETYSVPDHSATYVNPDGTIDRIPGHTSRSTSSGTYRYKGNTLTLTSPESPTLVLTRQGDTFVGEYYSTKELVFRKMD